MKIGSCCGNYISMSQSMVAGGEAGTRLPKVVICQFESVDIMESKEMRI